MYDNKILSPSNIPICINPTRSSDHIFHLTGDILEAMTTFDYPCDDMHHHY